MKKNYYYLVAGLPDLLPKDGAKGFDYDVIKDEILHELDGEDAALLQWLNFSYDNANALSLLAKSEDFDNRGFFSKEELAQELSLPENLPVYLREFLEEIAELADDVDHTILLNQKYYSALVEQHEWLAQWALFQVTLQNVVAATSARRLDVPVEDSLVLLSDIDEQFAKSSAEDFGLSSQLPWLDRVVSAFGDNQKLEETLDSLLWEKADELAEQHYFTVEAVLTFMIKLNSIERWVRLDSELGAQKLDELLAELTSALPQS